MSRTHKRSTAKESHTVYLSPYLWDDAEDAGLKRGISKFLEDHLKEYITLRKLENDYSLSGRLKE
jgi:hypothetical protein